MFLGPGTYANTIGSTDPTLLTVISGNLGNGIEMRGTHGNTVVGSLIGIDASGTRPLGNGGDGVFISNSSDNIIGRTTSVVHGRFSGPCQRDQLIAFNGIGIGVLSGSNNGIHGNSIYSNVALGIDLRPGAQSESGGTRADLGPDAGFDHASHRQPDQQTEFDILAGVFRQPIERIFGQDFPRLDDGEDQRTGRWRIHVPGVAPPLGNTYITATATDQTNNTRNFRTRCRSTRWIWGLGPGTHRFNGGVWGEA